jgi:NAD(P)H-dependent FMN reductase
MLNLMIVVGSVRPGRVGLPIATWAAQQAAREADVEVDLVDLLELGLPLMNEPNHPSLRQYEHAHTIEWSRRVERAHAFIFVTPEYNSAAAPALKNALDYLVHEWDQKPAGLICYGGASSGTRAVVSLLPTITALGLYRANPVLEIRSPGRKIVNGAFIPDEHDSATFSQQLERLTSVGESFRSMRTLLTPNA